MIVVLEWFCLVLWYVKNEDAHTSSCHGKPTLWANAVIVSRIRGDPAFSFDFLCRLFCQLSLVYRFVQRGELSKFLLCILLFLGLTDVFISSADTRRRGDFQWFHWTTFVHYWAIILLYQDIAMEAFGVTEHEVINTNKERRRRRQRQSKKYITPDFSTYLGIFRI